jgi:hypothetical protein
MLKYLFKAVFQDGSVYEQNSIDASLHTPEKSSFYDVLETEKSGNKLIQFILTGEGKTFTVDLITGALDINGVKLPSMLPLTNYRLIYFRRNELLFVGAANIGHAVTFHLGWQANDETGKNYQNVMEIT